MLLRRLRWVAILPGAVAAALLTYMFVAAWMELVLWWFRWSPDQWVYQLVMRWPAVCEGGAFVYVGARIAPEHQRLVGLVLAGLGFLLEGILIGAALLMADYRDLWYAVAVALGIGLAVYGVADEPGLIRSNGL